MTKLKRFGTIALAAIIAPMIGVGGALLATSAWAQTDKPTCAQSAATLVEQRIQNAVVLKGTTVCVLRVVQTAQGVERCSDGTVIVAVRAPIVHPGYNVDAVVTEETYFCSSQLQGK